MSAINSSENPSTIHAAIVGKTIIALNRSCDQCRFEHQGCIKLHLSDDTTICAGDPQRDRLSDPAIKAFGQLRSWRSLTKQFGEDKTVRDVVEYGCKNFRKFHNVGGRTITLIGDILETEYGIKDWWKT